MKIVSSGWVARYVPRQSSKRRLTVRYTNEEGTGRSVMAHIVHSTCIDELYLELRAAAGKGHADGRRRKFLGVVFQVVSLGSTVKWPLIWVQPSKEPIMDARKRERSTPIPAAVCFTITHEVLARSVLVHIVVESDSLHECK